MKAPSSQRHNCTERERPGFPCPNCHGVVFLVLLRGLRAFGRQELPDLEECATCQQERYVWG